MADQDWREVPWHKRTKEQRRARFAEAEAARKEKFSGQRAALAEQKQAVDETWARSRSEGAARPQKVARSRRDPNVQAYRALRAQAWMSNIQLGLMLAPIVIVLPVVVGFVIFVLVN
ncbi:hypothetical protein G7075_00180 [Phycicoccus sp. HDW14]|uniref:hypothetical protein n=1 Tax=Phycicoccus sp. HDW14 TaxID=2714941 RepID=UPI001409C40F|nr:hypothetical protein [Phycicoccus sp. HDW14]QIM19913.1 hypothetical protein G7075_00180 [Phycicoccus sp. HDW14]